MEKVLCNGKASHPLSSKFLFRDGVGGTYLSSVLLVSRAGPGLPFYAQNFTDAKNPLFR